MNDRQRTVLVIAVGFALLAVLAKAITTSTVNDGEWFNYTPNSGRTYTFDTSYDLWQKAAVWLIAIGIWTGLAMLIYRRRQPGPPPSR